MHQGKNPSSSPKKPDLPEHKKVQSSDWVKLVVGVIVVGALLIGSINFITGPSRERANIKENGIEATAISTGDVYVQSDRVSSRSESTIYKAWYEFTGNDNRTYRVVGEKDYQSESSVKKGMKATLRYIEDDPYSPEFIIEE